MKTTRGKIQKTIAIISCLGLLAIAFVVGVLPMITSNNVVDVVADIPSLETYSEHTISNDIHPLIQEVMNVHLFGNPDVLLGEAFNSFFGNPEWIFDQDFNDEVGMPTVEFHGYVAFDGERSSVYMIIVHHPEIGVPAHIMYLMINGEMQNGLRDELLESIYNEAN